ncbi:MAG: RnfABCDGE type electron transport complex subunit G [Bacteroidales bacterium]|nr:RnfABCDGE type electron transport complex subunit G [Bacteroidales bacterium]
MAKKLESTLTNMILSLTIIAMVMSAALAFVYLKTKGPIEEAAKQKELQAIKLVVPEFDSIFSDQIQNIDGVVIYPVSKENEILGYAIKTYTEKGFSGHIELMAGFLKDGSIYNIEVLQQNETPGLGTKMAEPKFKKQFSGKNPENFKINVKKDGGEVDAISSATISSRAFCDALTRAWETYKSGVSDAVTSVTVEADTLNINHEIE